MELDKFIVALGTPEEWSRNTAEIVSIEGTPEAKPAIDPKNIIGSVATKGEVDQALDSL